MNEHAKTEIKAGDTIKAYGIEWEILDTDFNGGILCLSKEPLCEKAFDENESNYYPESSICEYLAGLTKDLKGQGAEFKTVNLSMRADDGTGWDKDNYEVAGLFLLTADLYQEYRRYISNKAHWWWLATAYSFSSGYSRYTRYVYTDGSLNISGAYYGSCGVAPACIFSFLPEQRTKDTSEEIEELKKQAEELEKRIKEMEE